MVSIFPPSSSLLFVSTNPEPAMATTFVYYRYHPSFAAAIIFTIAFKLNLIVHLFLMIRKRTWFCIPLVIGAASESRKGKKIY
jgi:hypothetical protein